MQFNWKMQSAHAVWLTAYIACLVHFGATIHSTEARMGAQTTAAAAVKIIFIIYFTKQTTDEKKQQQQRHKKNNFQFQWSRL